jgi:Flp pilus assembly protein TadG
MRRPKSAKRARAERGSYLVEYSLVFLIFVFVFFGIMEFGRAVTAYNILAGATREGTRFAIVNGSRSAVPATSEAIQNRVRSWCIGLDASAVIVTTTWPDGDGTWPSGNGPSQRVNVKTRYDFVPVVGFLTGFTIGSSSQMVISQ